MFRKRAVFGVMLVLVLVLAIAGSAFALSGPKVSRRGHLEIEVSENGNRYIQDAEPVDEDGLPLYGTEFITEGYIYPPGTLDEMNGTLPDGSPEFPELVIGHWTCRGWHVGEGAHTVEGPVVVTTQIYDFNYKAPWGAMTIVTDGYEVMAPGKQFTRAVTGGTGQFKYARGEQHQTLINFPNNSIGVNLEVEFDLGRGGRFWPFDG